jgi:hypothetical protein
VAPTKTTSRRRSAAEPQEGKVRLTLAHPIGPTYQAGLGLDARDEDYPVGDEIDVYPHVARAIINAGYAQVDPEDPDAVAGALGIDREAAEKVVSEMAGDAVPVPEPTA